MRKPILILLALLGLSTAAHAQHRKSAARASSTHNFSLGLKAGASLNNFVGEDSGSPDYLVGFQAGIFGNVSLSQLFAFQPEILYSRKGAQFKSSDVRYKLDYIDIPLAFHLNTDGLFFEAGPQVGFLVGANKESGSLTQDYKSVYNSVDFGYLLGLGYQLKQGPGIGLRYNGGFVNVPAAVPTFLGTFQARERNSAFQLYLTYSFNSH